MTALNFDLIRLALEAEVEPSLFGPEQLGGYLVTFIVAIINVFVAYLFIKLLIFKPILKIIHAREDQINQQLKEAAEANEEAKKNESASKAAIDEAKLEASQIIADSKETAEKQSEIIISKANDEAADIIKRAEEDSKRMKKVAFEEMKDDMSDLVVAISGRVLGDVLPKETLEPLAKKHTAEALEAEVKKLD